MKLEEAIERGACIHCLIEQGAVLRDLQAIQLLIEAGKRLQELRRMKYVTYFVPLPGED